MYLCIYFLSLAITAFPLIILLSRTHELGHVVQILRTYKRTGFNKSLKIKVIYAVANPHTESDFYEYLMDNRKSPKIQKIIKSNAISGLIFSFCFLGLVVIMQLSLICILRINYVNFYIICLLVDIFGVWFSIRLFKIDKQIFKYPENYIYNYETI